MVQMNNTYKKITPYMAVVAAGCLAFGSLAGCKSLDSKVVETPAVIEQVVEAPVEEVVEEEPVAVEPVVEVAIEPEPVVEVAIEPVKSLEEKVVEASVDVSPAQVYVPTTSDLILDYITALEPNIESLYPLLSPKAQAFGLGLVDGLAAEVDALDVRYQLLAKEAADYLVKTFDVAGLIMEGENRFKKAPETEQEQIINWTDNLNRKLKGYIDSNPEGAQEFYNGLSDYVSNLEEAVQEKYTLGINF